MAIVSPRAGASAQAPVPVDWWDADEHRRLLAQRMNQILLGKLNAGDGVTLTANQTTTTLSDRRIGPESFIGFSPTTANAAAELGAGGFYVSSQGQYTATLTHANNAQTDRTFRYIVIG